MQTQALTNENIQSFLDSVKAHSESRNILKRRITWLLLTAEELLLDFKEAESGYTEFGYNVKSRFGVLTLEISVKGLERELTYKDNVSEEGEADFSKRLFRNLLNDLYGDIRFRYRNGTNIIILSVQEEGKKRKLPGSPVIYGAVLGIIIGLMLKYFAAEFAVLLTESAVSPLFNLILKMMKGCTEAVVFVSLISSVCTLTDSGVFRKSGRKMLSFFVISTAVLFFLCVAVCLPLFNVSGAGKTDFSLSDAVTLLISSVPTSFITPFVDGNMLQIVILAVVIGLVLLALNDKMSHSIALIGELRFCFSRILQYFLKIVPFFVFLSILKIIITVDLSEISRIWKIVAVDQGLDIILMFFMLAFVSVRYRIPLSTLLKKISPVLNVAASTGSCTAAIPSLYETLHKKLGVDEKFANYWIPLSSTLYAPSAVFAMTIYSFFSAECQGAGLGISQMLILFILVLIMSIASPRVPGGLVATVAIILAQLGLSGDQLGLITSANVIMVYLDAAFATVLRCTVAVVMSKREKMCDLSVLRDGKV